MATYHKYDGAIVDGASHYVMVATPVGVAPCADFTRSLAGMVETLVRTSIQFDINLLQGHCHVDDARNALIRDFLQSKCTDLFFIDADMGFHGNNVYKLLKVPGDIVAGVYCHKSDEGTFPFHPFRDERSHLPNKHGLYEMPKVATGFMRLRRHVVQALYESEKAKGRLSRPGDELGNDERQNLMPVARIVERGFPRELGLEAQAGNDAYQSGDYVLSLKARKLGFKLWVYPDMEFSHTGEKTWRAHFGNTMRQQQGLWQPGFVQAVADVRAGRGDLATFERLAMSYRTRDDYPLAPGPLRELYLMARETSGHVLETGSGLSTLVLGLALGASPRAGAGRVAHALEHDAKYFQETKKLLDDFDIDSVVLHYAPLDPDTLSYGVDGLPQFSLALLDGPPGRYGRLASVKALAPYICNATLAIDDAEREDATIDWLREQGCRLELKADHNRWWALGTWGDGGAAPANHGAAPLSMQAAE